MGSLIANLPTPDRSCCSIENAAIEWVCVTVLEWVAWAAAEDSAPFVWWSCFSSSEKIGDLLTARLQIWAQFLYGESRMTLMVLKLAEGRRKALVQGIGCCAKQLPGNLS